MCRHLAYLGPPIPLSRLLIEPPHSLLRQSYAPKDMRRGGRFNADGYGFGWYAGGPAALRYRRGCPMWTDGNLATLTASITSAALLAAVRNATVGMPVLETAAAPFVEGPWLFSHNGAVAGWPDTMVKLAERLPTRDLLTLDAPTDAALLWALIRYRLRQGATLADATARTVVEVDRAAPGSRLNLLLTDGTQVVATTAGHSLSVRRGPDSLLVSSEPLDDEPDWEPVVDGKLVVGTPSDVDITDWGSA
jgi:gamma-glutamyl hercynylcysteine S-oxide hydrolase